MDSFRQKVDLNKRTKRRGTMFPGALLKQFKDASQLPEVGLDDDEEEEEEEEEKPQKIIPPPIQKKKISDVSATRGIKITTPLTPTNSPDDSTTNNPEATDEIQRANELLKKFDTIQARIKKNLENIEKQEKTRYSIIAEKQKQECCCTEAAPVTTNVVVQKIMEEIAKNRALHPEYVVDGDVKQLRTEIGQYKNVLRHVSDVNEAVEKTEEVLMQKSKVCCPGKCGLLLRGAGEKKETGVQYEKGW